MEKRRNMNQKVDQKRIPRLKQREKKKKKMENTGKHPFLSSICVTGGPGEKRENGIKAIF